MTTSLPSSRRRLRLVQITVLVVALALLALALLSRQGGGEAAFRYLPRGSVKVAAPTGQAGEVLLTVQGQGAQAGTRAFTLQQLEALPAVRYRARQPQLKREFEYTGVPLRDLAAAAGLSGRNLRLTASDAFGATIAAADYEHYPVLLAYLADGQPITVAEKGPLLVVFPNLDEPERFANVRYGPKWVWFAEHLQAAPQ